MEKNYLFPKDQSEIAGRCYVLCVVPKQFYQLLNIFLQYKSHSLSAIHILMSTKTGTLYDKVVEKIKEIQTMDRTLNVLATTYCLQIRLFLCLIT